MLTSVSIAVGIFFAGVLAGGVAVQLASRRWHLKVLSSTAPTSTEPQLDHEELATSITQQLLEGIRPQFTKIEASSDEIAGMSLRVVANTEKIIQKTSRTDQLVRQLLETVEQSYSKDHLPPTVRPVDEPEIAARSRSDTEDPTSSEIVDVASLIAKNFQRIDIETKRQFDLFRSRFMALLQGRVCDIQQDGGVVLFFETHVRAQAWPWPNGQIGRPWLDFFKLPKGAGYPVSQVVRPALVQVEGQEWHLTAKGAVEQ